MIREQYKSRSAHFVYCIQRDEWNIKVYSLSCHQDYVPEVIMLRALTKLPQCLAAADLSIVPIHNVATLIVHEALDGFYLLVNWWANDNMLQHFVYFSVDSSFQTLERISDDGYIACVWELEIIHFERNAWVECVLKQQGGVDAYLKQQFHGLY